MITPLTVRLVCPHCSLGFTTLVAVLQSKRHSACPACAAGIDTRPLVAELALADRRLQPAQTPRPRSTRRAQPAPGKVSLSTW